MIRYSLCLSREYLTIVLQRPLRVQRIRIRARVLQSELTRSHNAIRRGLFPLLRIPNVGISFRIISRHYTDVSGRLSLRGQIRICMQVVFSVITFEF